MTKLFTVFLLRERKVRRKTGSRKTAFGVEKSSRFPVEMRFCKGRKNNVTRIYLIDFLPSKFSQKLSKWTFWYYLCLVVFVSEAAVQRCSFLRLAVVIRLVESEISIRCCFVDENG